jgi:hypothetical protein
MNDQSIEQEIQTKGKTAPRVTPADIEANIVTSVYFTAQDGLRSSDPDFAQYSPKSLDLLTFCVLVLKNGFTVTGESACASPENFDAEIGRKIARQNAVQKIWPLMGYELRSKLMNDAGTLITQPTSTDPALPPHQQRVVQEKQELDEKLGKLNAFITSSPIFANLDMDEQSRLQRQAHHMEYYSSTLGERIAAF